jgi:hypothetical protein
MVVPDAVRFRGLDQQLLSNFGFDLALADHVAEPASGPIEHLVAIALRTAFKALE